MTTRLHRRGFLGATTAGVALSAAGISRAADAPTPPSLEIYAQSPFIDQIALSPEGDRCAVISQKGDEKLLMTFDVANIKPDTRSLGPAKVRGLFWGDESHVVLVHSQTTTIPEFAGARHEFLLAQIIDLNSGKAKTLFGNANEFYNIVSGDLHRIRTGDGYQVTASGYRMSGEYSLSLYSFPLDNKPEHFITQGTSFTEGWILTPEGFPLAYSDFDSGHKWWKLYYNVAAPGQTNQFKMIYEVDRAVNTPDLVGLGRDGASVILFVHGEGTGGSYHEIGADGVLSDPLDKDSDGVGTPLFDPVTWRLVGFSHCDDWPRNDYFDPFMQKLAAAVPGALSPDMRYEIVSFAEDPRKMIVYAESPTNAGSHYFIDFTAAKFVPIAPNYPALPKAWISHKHPIHYAAADGLVIHGYLTLPPFKDPRNLPLVVLPHGGPEDRDDLRFDWQAQLLASRGYAVLQPNFRGSSGYGSAFIKAGYGEWGRKMQTDLSDGVRDLVKQGLVDPKRVAIMGASYGGYAALAGATLDTGVYKCAISIAGPSDLQGMINFTNDNNDSGDSQTVLHRKEMMGDPAGYDQISPARQAAKADCPILLIHGTDDTVVPISQSQTMLSALKGVGKDVEFVTFKGQDHWETMESSRISMMKAAMDFLAKHNPA